MLNLVRMDWSGLVLTCESDLFRGIICRLLDFHDLWRLRRVCRNLKGAEEWAIEITGRVGKRDIGVIRQCEVLSLRGVGVGLVKGVQWQADWGRRLRVLELNGARGFGDKELKLLKNILVLRLPKCSEISDGGIMGLLGLQILDLSSARRITDKGICKLTELVELVLYYNVHVTLEGLRGMSKLRLLYMPFNRNFAGLDIYKEIPSVDSKYLFHRA